MPDREYKNLKIGEVMGYHRLIAFQKKTEGGDIMLKPATAIRKFFSTDCCDTGRLYPSVSVPEIKELKETCSPMDYVDLGQAVIKHLMAHELPPGAK